jgi:hypothetical chaperone protein
VGAPHHPAEPIVFNFLTTRLFAFRSALCFWDEGDETIRRSSPRRAVGDPELPRARGRLPLHPVAQVLRREPPLRVHRIYGRAYKFEDLFAAFFKRLRAHAAPQLDDLPRELLVGRPVAYAGSRPDPALAMKRYEAALAPFGFGTSARSTSRSPRRSSTRSRSRRAPRCWSRTSAAARRTIS